MQPHRASLSLAAIAPALDLKRDLKRNVQPHRASLCRFADIALALDIKRPKAQCATTSCVAVSLCPRVVSLADRTPGHFKLRCHCARDSGICQGRLATPCPCCASVKEASPCPCHLKQASPCPCCAAISKKQTPAHATLPSQTSKSNIKQASP